MRTATLDLSSRGSFVDDLNSKPGIVMRRDALLHRSHEIQPAFYDSGFFRKTTFFFWSLWDLSGAGWALRDGGGFAAVGRGGGSGYAALCRTVGATHDWLASARRVRTGFRTDSAYLLGLLAKIKCSICSYQLNLWYT